MKIGIIALRDVGRLVRSIEQQLGASVVVVGNKERPINAVPVLMDRGPYDAIVIDEHPEARGNMPWVPVVQHVLIYAPFVPIALMSMNFKHDRQAQEMNLHFIWLQDGPVNALRVIRGMLR